VGILAATLFAASPATGQLGMLQAAGDLLEWDRLKKAMDESGHIDCIDNWRKVRVELPNAYARNTTGPESWPGRLGNFQTGQASAHHRKT
jgi:hypothetical protein